MGSRQQASDAAAVAAVRPPSPRSIFRSGAFTAPSQKLPRTHISFQPPIDYDTTENATNYYMAAHPSLAHPAPYYSDLSAQSSSPLSMPTSQAGNGVAPPPIGTPPSVTQILMRRLPADTTEQSLQLMFVWSKDLRNIRLLAADPSQEDGTRSAVVTFGSHSGAVDARDKLNGRAIQSNGAGAMILEILPNATPQQGSAGGSPPNGRLSSDGSAASSLSGSRRPSRLNGRLHSVDIGPTLGNGFISQDLANSDTPPQLQSTFNRQLPIGSQRPERSGPSSSIALINDDMAADDETHSLIWNTARYASGDSSIPEPRLSSQRRATAPHLPLEATMAGLSLNTNNPMSQPASMPRYPASASSHPNIVSPLSSTASPMTFVPGGNQHYGRPMPAVNPADQNPPCNTLYVGNLPLNTSEEELKATFGKARGFKRLCFRTKSNGPMCFVEFEDISCATRALSELYGHHLHNSTKGGIRLSFSKNPLGVRSGHSSHQSNGQHMGSHMNHTMPGPNNQFSSANGPPPGLAAPPGLSNPHQSFQPQNQSHNTYPNFQNGLQNGLHNGLQNGVGRGRGLNNHQNSQNGFPSSGAFAPHMMGR